MTGEPGTARDVVLVVEDNPGFLTAVSEVLRQEGYDVRQAATMADALAMLERTERLQALVTDLSLPGEQDGGLALARAAQTRFPDARIVVMTGHAVRLPGYLVLRKPFRADDLLALLP